MLQPAPDDFGTPETAFTMRRRFDTYVAESARPTKSGALAQPRSASIEPGSGLTSEDHTGRITARHHPAAGTEA